VGDLVGSEDGECDISSSSSDVGNTNGYDVNGDSTGILESTIVGTTVKGMVVVTDGLSSLGAIVGYLLGFLVGIFRGSKVGVAEYDSVGDDVASIDGSSSSWGGTVEGDEEGEILGETEG
jgi:hypothetical protein